MRISTHLPNELMIIPESREDVKYLRQFGFRGGEVVKVTCGCTSLRTLPGDARVKSFCVYIDKRSLEND
jgi:hypothetical protein